MYADPISLTDGSAEVDFNRVNVSTNQSNYVSAVDYTEAKRIGFRLIHSTSKPIKADPNYIINRHVLTFTQSEYIAASLRNEVATVNVSINLPNSGNISRAELDKLLAHAGDFIGTTAHVDKLLRGEL